VEFSVASDDLVLINEDASNMQSISDGTIDLVFSRSVMEHIKDAEAVYKEIFRVLKPGGKYIFLTPNRYDYVSLLASAVPNRFHAAIVRHTEGRREINTFPTFYRSNSFAEIRKLSDAVGFDILEMSRLNQYPAYLTFSRALFWCGCLYEKVLDKVAILDCLKGWILCALEKPLRQGAGSQNEKRRESA
jgi:SAM-dependent methyltransferase